MFRQRFSGVRVVELTVSDVEIHVSGDAATVTCTMEYAIDWERDLGEPRETRRTTFRLQRTGDRWTVQSGQLR
jgi:ketosteroid isomerase-like protein